MYGIIQELYNDKNQEAFVKLYNDSESNVQLLMRSTIAEAFKDCPRILESHGSDWILCTLSSYHKGDNDTLRIFQALMNKFDSISFGMLTDDIKYRTTTDIADTCLVGLSFFRDKINSLHKRRAAPSADYYIKTGSLAFHRIGFDNIGDDFNGWVSFIQKEMGE